MFKIVIIMLSLTYVLMSDNGCNVLVKKKTQLCQESTVLNQNKNSSFESNAKSDTINISRKLTSVETQHLDYNVTIERVATHLAPSCPPFCIQPIKIEKVETVGELEVLSFIDEVKRKRDGLLIDVRKNSKYKEETIPSAINLPYEMLTESSPYQKEVLKSLGAKKIKRGWLFKNPQKLLIFGESSFSPEASKAVKKLIKLGYPTNKILYYRGGIVSWKTAGLTLI